MLRSPRITPILASTQGTLAVVAMAKRTRRLFGARRSAARLDVLVATDVDLSSEGEGDHAARPGYCKRGNKRFREEGGGQSDGSGLHGFNRGRGNPIGASGEKVSPILRRTVTGGATVGRGLYHPCPCRMSRRALLTPT